MNATQGTTNLKSYRNPEFDPGGTGFSRMLWYFTNHLLFRSPFFPFYGLKRSLLRAFGARVGKGVIIKPRVNIKFPWKLHLGEYCWIGEGVWIDNLDQVTVGTHACVSQGALLLCGNHNYKKPSFDLITRPITLEAGVWIGARAVVTGGVHAGSHALLVTGSVASSNMEPYGIYRGNPAEKIKTRVIA